MMANPIKQMLIETTDLFILIHMSQLRCQEFSSPSS